MKILTVRGIHEARLADFVELLAVLVRLKAHHATILVALHVAHLCHPEVVPPSVARGALAARVRCHHSLAVIHQADRSGGLSLVVEVAVPAL